MKNKKQNYWSEEEMNILDCIIEKDLPHNESIRQVQSRLNNRSYHSINLKLSRMKKPNVTRTNPFFYSDNTIAAMKEAIDTTETLTSIANRFAVILDKSPTAVLSKIAQLSKSMPTRKRTKFSKVGPTFPKVKASAVPLIKDKLHFEPDTMQQPADVGVEVPHGMTFEGKPKRITLHSDHFRIYF